jgi:hypothetical protein
MAHEKGGAEKSVPRVPSVRCCPQGRQWRTSRAAARRSYRSSSSREPLQTRAVLGRLDYRAERRRSTVWSQFVDTLKQPMARLCARVAPFLRCSMATISARVARSKMPAHYGAQKGGGRKSGQVCDAFHMAANGALHALRRGGRTAVLRRASRYKRAQSSAGWITVRSVDARQSGRNSSIIVDCSPWRVW